MNPLLKTKAFLLTAVFCLSPRLSFGDSWLTETENGLTRILKITNSGFRITIFAEPTTTSTRIGTTFVNHRAGIIRVPSYVHINSADGVSTARTSKMISLVNSGEPVAGGGTLQLNFLLSQPTVNNKEQIAFYSAIVGNTSNQGIFLADASGLHALVFGCGDGGGGVDSGPPECGTPSPLGGTFSGLFGGTADAPDINDHGDVLFVADVLGGSSRRGLFLFRSSTQRIIKVAAVGDESPFGGTFRAIGTGSVNNNGEVSFIAATSSSALKNEQILLWKEGKIRGIARTGDQAPGGGIYVYLTPGISRYKDGTARPNFAPGLNDHGVISFWARILRDGDYHQALFCSKQGSTSMYVQDGEKTPAGGVFDTFYNPILNNAGQIAFFAETLDASGKDQAGWFAGKPGNWRKGFITSDKIKGIGTIVELATSINPITSYDRYGNLIFWIKARYPGGNDLEQVIVSKANGQRLLKLTQGDTSPSGLVLSINPWPALDARARAAVSIPNSHLILNAFEP